MMPEGIFFNHDKNGDYEKNGEKTKPEEDQNHLPVCAVNSWVNDVTSRYAFFTQRQGIRINLVGFFPG